MPADSMDDVFAVFAQSILLHRWVLKALVWVGGPVILALTILAFLGWTRTIPANVFLLTKICTTPKCATYHYNHNALVSTKPLPYNSAAQVALAQYYLPIFITEAFSVNTSQADKYAWTTFVLPYLGPNSQAESYFTLYLQKHPFDAISNKEVVTVAADPVAPPTQPNTYVVGWTETASNGQATKSAHYAASITISFGGTTAENTYGFFIQTFTPLGTLVQPSSAP